MLGRRTVRSGLTAMLLVLITACGSATPSSPGGDGTEPDQTSSLLTSDTQTTEAAPPPPATEPATEAAPSPPPVETDGPEPPVAGGETGVSIELAGLPVGTGGTVPVGDTWCGVFFWGQSLPAGVELRITDAVAETEGARVLDQPCKDSPPCPGTTISLETPEQGCGVTVLPPSPDVDLVVLRLDGVVHCQDPATCEELVLASGATAALENPNGALVPEGDGTEGDGTGTEGDDTGTEGDGTGTEGDGTGTEGDGTGTEGDGTGTEGDGTGTEGDGTGDDPGAPGSDSDESTAGPDGG